MSVSGYGTWQRGERKIPHIHFISKDEKIKGAIRLDIAAYYKHDNYLDELPKKAKLEFNKKMREGGWLMAVETWNNCVPQGNKINLPENREEIVIPDYTKL